MDATLHLGKYRGVHLLVKLSDTSAVQNENYAPIAHLVIVPDDETMTWRAFREAGFGKGDLASVADRAMEQILDFFLPELTPFDAAWRFEINSNSAAQRETVHTHLIVGHRTLFGTQGIVRRSTDSALKPTPITRT